MYLAWDGQPLPMELTRWTLAERFHWTLPDVDALSVADLHQLIQVDDGRKNAREQLSRVKHG